MTNPYENGNDVIHESDIESNSDHDPMSGDSGDGDSDSDSDDEVRIS